MSLTFYKRKVMKTILFILFVLPLVINADGIKKYNLANNMFLELKEQSFIKEEHKITFCSNSKQSICLITNRIPFGTDGNIPKENFTYIKLQVQNKEYILQSTDMYDAWGSRAFGDDDVMDYFVARCYDSNNCIARGLFSDGAGSFIAEWQIRSGVSQRTVLTSQVDLIRAFIQDMHPPVHD